MEILRLRIEQKPLKIYWRWCYDVDMEKLLLGDCLELMKGIEDGSVDCVFTDPPYPNRAGHFVDGIESAGIFLQTFKCKRWLVFWDEMERPIIPLPLVAVHIWYRNNSNRPDNYEPIYEYNVDGIKRSSRVFSFPVVYPNMTGMNEATGHPTQKNQKLIIAMIKTLNIEGTILDPFMGSGTTGVACIHTNRNFIGIEKDESYFNIAKQRIETAQLPLL